MRRPPTTFTERPDYPATPSCLEGHANLSITLDRYGHPMPGNEDEAAALLDGYLARSMADAGRTALVAGA
jgi:hypothetical protein